MFSANRGGQGQQYSSVIVTCDERYWNYNVDKHNYCITMHSLHYCIIMHYQQYCSILQHPAMSALLLHLQSLHYCKHHAVFAVLQHHTCKVDFMQSRQYNYCSADIDINFPVIMVDINTYINILTFHVLYFSSNVIARRGFILLIASTSSLLLGSSDPIVFLFNHM